MNMEVFCVQYLMDYRRPFAFFYALSAQDAVNHFRACRSDTVVAVYRMKKVVDWE